MLNLSPDARNNHDRSNTTIVMEGGSVDGITVNGTLWCAPGVRVRVDGTTTNLRVRHASCVELLAKARSFRR